MQGAQIKNSDLQEKICWTEQISYFRSRWEGGTYRSWVVAEVNDKITSLKNEIQINWSTQK
jgi:hypothetical protein